MIRDRSQPNKSELSKLAWRMVLNADGGQNEHTIARWNAKCRELTEQRDAGNLDMGTYAILRQHHFGH